MTDNRQYELPFGELVDKITIKQLQEMLLNSDKYATEIAQLEHDIDLVMKQRGTVANARMIRLVFLMGQLNTLIWIYKDRMTENDSQENYAKYLALSHQVNGLKNSVKNKLMQELGEPSSSLKTNTWVDSLEYRISV